MADDESDPEIQTILADDPEHRDREGPSSGEGSGLPTEIRKLILKWLATDSTQGPASIRERLELEKHNVPVEEIQRFLHEIRSADQRS